MPVQSVAPQPTATNVRVYSPAPSGRAAGRATSDATAAGREASAAASRALRVPASANLWAIGLLLELNAILAAQHRKQVPITVNNVTNLTRWLNAESGGNIAGFLRDQNPFNVGTYPGVTSGSYGGHLVNRGYAVTNVFDSVSAGQRATAEYWMAQTPSIVRALQNNVPTAMFGGALQSAGWNKWASYATPQAFPARTDPRNLATTGVGNFVASLTQGEIDALIHSHVLAGGGGFSGVASPSGSQPYGPATPLTESQIISRIEAHIRSNGPRGAHNWTKDLELLTSFNALSYAQRQHVLGTVEHYAQTYNNPDTTLGADIGRGFDKTVNAIKSAVSPFEFLAHIDWKRVGIFTGGLALAVGGTAIYLGTSVGPKILERAP